jgi:hypothetical protein
MIFGVSTATEIKFSPDVWNIWKGCIVATDIIVNTDNKEIAATDIIIESSMEFVDFVPSNLFPYFLPPKVNESVLHLVGFTVDPQHRMKGTWSIGTLYMKQKNTTDSNGSLKLYFTKVWDTTDSNLSVAWGIDVLDTIGDAYYTFTDENICTHEAAGINWWIGDMTLTDMSKQISRDQRIKNISNRKNLVSFAWLLIVLTFLYLYYKRAKQWRIA